MLSVGDLGLISGSERSPGGGHGNPLQYFCLENSMDREAWWATVQRAAKSQTRLSDWAQAQQQQSPSSNGSRKINLGFMGFKLNKLRIPD